MQIPAGFRHHKLVFPSVGLTARFFSFLSAPCAEPQGASGETGRLRTAPPHGEGHGESLSAVAGGGFLREVSLDRFETGVMCGQGAEQGSMFGGGLGSKPERRLWTF